MKRKLFTIFFTVLMITFIQGCGASDKATEETQNEQTETEEKEKAADEIGKAESAEDTKPELTGTEKLKADIAGMQITYNFGEMQEVLKGEEISAWLVDLPDGSVSVNETPAKEYVASLAKKYDTFGQTRTFTTHSGDEITVSGGDYGFWMDRVSTRQELIDQILTGQDAEMSPVYYGTATVYGTDDIGDTYVEISLRDQHLWVYKEGSVINESDFVSGCLFKGNETPVGTYGITYKERDATLVGQGYESSVKYWMPFNGNIGMHDASWRSSFGGHLYYMNGSHGCINLPTSKAAEIYDQVEKGEPVVVYGGLSKEEAISTMTAEEKTQAMQKGYISMTVDDLAKQLEQQGLDPATARMQAELQMQMKNMTPEQQAAFQAAQQAAAQQAAALQAAQQGATQ